MAFAEGNQEVETLPTKAPAQSLAQRVGSRDSYWRPQNSYTQIRETLVDFLSEDTVPIMDYEAIGMVARQCFPGLLQRPFRRGMGRGVVVENSAGFDLHDHEDSNGFLAIAGIRRVGKKLGGVRPGRQFLKINAPFPPGCIRVRA